jgi:hypothetical protein
MASPPHPWKARGAIVGSLRAARIRLAARFMGSPACPEGSVLHFEAVALIPGAWRGTALEPPQG